MSVACFGANKEYEIAVLYVVLKCMEMKSNLKLILAYGLVLAIGTLLLAWLENRYLLRALSTEFYIVLLCGVFTALGIWFGIRLSRSNSGSKHLTSEEPNTRALAYLGISRRECDVLVLLAAGHSNKEIAAKLFVSRNTVKTHLHKLYQKLDVSRRGQAVEKARSLSLVP